MTAIKTTVCQVLHTLEVGGAEMLAARLARQLQDRFRFVFACLDGLGTLGNQLRSEGFVVKVLGRRSGIDWKLPLRLARWYRHEQIDVVHAHQYTPFFYAATARLFARRPVLFTEHGRAFPDFPRRKRIFANRFLLGRKDRVVGVGQAVAQALKDNEGIASDRIGIIYNGIPLDSFNGPAADRTTIRKEMGLGEKDLVLLQVARLDYLKDHATAIRTLHRIVQQCPSVHLVLVGVGPEREKIEEEIARLDVGRNVHLLGLRADVPRLLSAADVFLLTSISEGIPLTVIEAMASRLPVVATRVGGMGEVVEENTTGFLAPSGDDAALAQHILRLLAEPELRTNMGDLGRHRAHALFSETRMQEEYALLYQEMGNHPLKACLRKIQHG